MRIISRRDLLKGLACGSLTLPLSQLLHPSVSLAETTEPGSSKNLIVLNFEGGNDSLFLFPYISDPTGQGFVDYLQANRPNTFVAPGSILPANGYLGFHPNWAALHPEYGLDKVALIQSVGISPGTPPGGSHNFCQNIYSFGVNEFTASSKAWFARFMELNNLEGFGFGTGGRVDFATDDPAKAPIVGIKAADLTYADPFDAGSARRDLNIETAREFLQLENPSEKAVHQKVKLSLSNSLDVMDLMGDVISTPLVGIYQDNTPGRTLKSIAQTIRYFKAQGNTQDRVFYAFQGGFDNHAAQAPNLGNLISAISINLAALILDLKASGTYQDTVIVTISEFGRTAKENGGEGTDHGWGSTSMVVGGPVQGGVYGSPPDAGYMYLHNHYPAQLAFQNILSEALDWMNLQFKGDDIFPPSTYQVSGLNLFGS